LLKPTVIFWSRSFGVFCQKFLIAFVVAFMYSDKGLLEEVLSTISCVGNGLFSGAVRLFSVAGTIAWSPTKVARLLTSYQASKNQGFFHPQINLQSLILSRNAESKASG